MYSGGGNIDTIVYLHLTQTVASIPAYTYTNTNNKYPADPKPVTVYNSRYETVGIIGGGEVRETSPLVGFLGNKWVIHAGEVSMLCQ